MPSSAAVHEAHEIVPDAAPSPPPRAEAVIDAFAGPDNIGRIESSDRHVIVHVRDTTKVSETALHDLGFVGAIMEGDRFILLGPVDVPEFAGQLEAALGESWKGEPQEEEPQTGESQEQAGESQE